MFKLSLHIGHFLSNLVQNCLVFLKKFFVLILALALVQCACPDHRACYGLTLFPLRRGIHSVCSSSNKLTSLLEWMVPSYAQKMHPIPTPSGAVALIEQGFVQQVGTLKRKKYFVHYNYNSESSSCTCGRLGPCFLFDFRKWKPLSH